MPNPYTDLPNKAFWKTAVGTVPADEIGGLWSPKFCLSQSTPIATFGSCFAQHFAKALSARGYHWLDTEPVPNFVSEATARRFNYGVFSARTGNIYTTSALCQWLDWASGKSEPPSEIWTTEGRYYDPFRPAIEPNGFKNAGELQKTRTKTLRAFKRAVTEADVFVFTLGLTESWQHRDGYTYAMCPGTVAGEFDGTRHEFVNLRTDQVAQSLTAAIETLRSLNPKIKVLLTVSPVPLTATASGEHVLTATTYSKSVLRAVAGEIAQTDPNIDYFPSYEIITAPAFSGRYYKANKRSVDQGGVDFVMNAFFACMNARFGEEVDTSRTPDIIANDDDDLEKALVCEEEMLSAFAPAAENTK